MSMTVQRGSAFSGQYTSAVITTASDWVGTAQVYATYPGTAIFSVDLTLSGDGTKLLFTLPLDQVLGLTAGTYSIVGNLKSTALNIDTYRVDYLTVTNAPVGVEPMTRLTMTVLKVDGTPAGREIRKLTNSLGGATLQMGWAGVVVTCSHPTAFDVVGGIVGTEVLTAETDPSGYAQFDVIRGAVVTVACPSFGKTVTVDTTGLDTVDLSSYF